MSSTLPAPAMTPASEKSGTSVYFDADSGTMHAAHHDGGDPNASTDTVTAAGTKNNSDAGAGAGADSDNANANGADVDRQPSVATGGKKSIFGILTHKRSKHSMDADHNKLQKSPETKQQASEPSEKGAASGPANSKPMGPTASMLAAPGVRNTDGRISSGYAADSEIDGDAGERYGKTADSTNPTTVDKKSNAARHSIGGAPVSPEQGYQMQQRQTSAPAKASNEPAVGGLFLPKAPAPISMEDDKEMREPINASVGTTGGARDSGYTEAPIGAVTGMKSEPAAAPVEASQLTRAEGPAQGPINQGPVQAQTIKSEHEKRRSSLTGAFAAGAALTGPAAQPEENITHQQRTATAESSMSDGALAKIAKAEKKDAKQLMKVIKSEGKVQKDNLKAALKELTRLQKVQKQAAKDESHALSKHAKAASYEHKLHTRYLSAKASHESAAADLNAKIEQLEMSRKHAQHETEELSKKTREVEELRRQKAVDDREREAKLQQLSEQGRKK